MVTKHDELLFQRCVDGELSNQERRELLLRVEQLPDGWKTLACSFMEDQLFAGAAIDAAGGFAASKFPVKSAVSSPAGSRSWFAHPATSLVLSLCVAFLAGLLVSGGMNPSNDSQIVSTESTDAAASVGRDPATSDSSASASLVSDEPNYSVRFEAEGMSPRDFPIYDDSATFLSRFMEHQRQNASKDTVNDKESPASQINFLRIRMDDGRTIVVPFEGSVPKFQ